MLVTAHTMVQLLAAGIRALELPLVYLARINVIKIYKSISVNNLKKQLLPVLFILCAAIFNIGSPAAQSWTAAIGGQQNPCQNKTQCQCPQQFSFGKANSGNCSIDGYRSGCWNPTANGTGACYACGDGGTVAIGELACFDKGYGNYPNSQNSPPIGISCNSSSVCAGSGRYSGG
jgi:hypothetical protein